MKLINHTHSSVHSDVPVETLAETNAKTLAETPAEASLCRREETAKEESLPPHTPSLIEEREKEERGKNQSPLPPKTAFRGNGHLEGSEAAQGTTTTTPSPSKTSACKITLMGQGTVTDVTAAADTTPTGQGTVATDALGTSPTGQGTTTTMTPPALAVAEKKPNARPATTHWGNGYRPTHDEAKAYYEEQNFGNFTVEEFMDYYMANGWMLRDGVAVRDWRAVMRGWERNRRRQPASNSGGTAPAASNEQQRQQKLEAFLDERCPLPPTLSDLARNYLRDYDPSQQARFGVASRIDQLLSSASKTILEASCILSLPVVERVLIRNIHDLCLFTDTPPFRFPLPRMFDMAQLIIAQFGYLKTGEFLLAMQQIKACEYGELNDRLSPSHLSSLLKSFSRWRQKRINKLY